MQDNIFSLVYSDYDTVDHYFFRGPEGVNQEDFKKLCDQLAPKAGYQSVLKKSSPKEGGGWICWRDVVEALVSLLEQQGYQRVSLDAYHFHGKGTIIGVHEFSNQELDEGLGFAGPLIADYNRKIEKKMAEERKARKGLRLGTLKKRTVQIIK